MVDRLPVLADTPGVVVPMLWSTLPVPPEKTAVRLVLVPAVMTDWAAVKLEITGAATTVTIAVPGMLNAPAALVAMQERDNVPTEPALNVMDRVVPPVMIVPPAIAHVKEHPGWSGTEAVSPVAPVVTIDVDVIAGWSGKATTTTVVVWLTLTLVLLVTVNV